MVKYPLAGLDVSASQGSCSMNVETLNVTMTKSVQANRGFIVDKEVKDVKINKAETLLVLLLGDGFLR